MKVIYYGKEDESLKDKFFDTFGNINYYIVKLDNKIGEDNVIYHTIKKYNIKDEDLIFINYDTMKPSYKFNINDIINNVNIYQKYKKNYFIFFNRYLDSGNQVKYLTDIPTIPYVSLYESFNPGNSDAFFMDKNIVNIVHNNIKTKRELFDIVRRGIARGYSFNPNLITYDFENSIESNIIEFSKSAPITKNEYLDFEKLNRNISIFFSDHILIFWLFIVFFICLIFLIIMRKFKWMEKYL